MNRKPLVFATLALGALLVLPTVAAAQESRAPRCNNFRAIARVLQLSATQSEQARSIYSELRTTVEPLHDQIAPLKEALEDLLDTATPSAADVGEVVIDIDGIHDQIAAARAAADDEFEAILTAEQVTRWERFQSSCRQGYQR
jgi:hypothetical protein